MLRSWIGLAVASVGLGLGALTGAGGRVGGQETQPPLSAPLPEQAAPSGESDVVPESQPTPSPSPVPPDPSLDTATEIQVEIREIRRELVTLLERLQILEERLAGLTTAVNPPTSVAANPPGSPPPEIVASPPPPETTVPPILAPSPPSEPPGSNGTTLSLGTQTLSLPGDVLFDFNQAEIRPEAERLLRRMARSLAEMPRATVQVIGHTDNIGSDRYNLDLSLRRATAVRDYLSGLLPAGRDRFRWSSIGHGESAPIADNDTEEGRQRNRRVDLIITPR